MNLMTLSIIAIIYLGIVAYLGFRGYSSTKNSSDYLVAGRQIHPFVMALSYGATFISTSAIVGFGGAAAVFGMGLLWLTFLNIFLGIFIAFTFFGKRTRKMGHHLNAHTFPELLGKRFNSRFIQGFSGLIVVGFMPLYAAAVLIGAARFIESAFGINYEIAVSIFSIIIAAYVVAGGLKSVMYTDALQGALMFIGMVILVVFTYAKLGGVTEAHRQLDELPARIEAQYQKLTPEIRAVAPEGLDDGALFGWFAGQVGELGKTKTMSKEERAAFMAANPHLKTIGGLLKSYPALVSKLVIAKVSKGGFQGWTHMPVTGSNMFYVLVTSIIMGVGIGVLAQPQLAVRFMTVRSGRELNRAMLVGGVFILATTGVAFVVGNLCNVWFALPENGGVIALGVPSVEKNIDKIIPEFIGAALPSWFGAIFMLTLLSAAMSTLSSQFHAMGTSIGRDFWEKGILGSQESTATILITRIGVILSIIATVLLAYKLPAGIIAAATAVFFGLCASAFLPAFVGGLFWRRMTRAGAIASILAGSGSALFWMLMIQNIKGKLPALLASKLLGRSTLLPDAIAGVHWNWVESLFIALPISAIVAIAVSLMTQPESEEHLDKCFHGM